MNLSRLLFWRRQPKDDPPPGGFYKDGEWRDPIVERGFNVKPTNETDPEFRFHRRGE